MNSAITNKTFGLWTTKNSSCTLAELLLAYHFSLASEQRNNWFYVKGGIADARTLADRTCICVASCRSPLASTRFTIKSVIFSPHLVVAGQPISCDNKEFFNHISTPKSIAQRLKQKTALNIITTTRQYLKGPIMTSKWLALFIILTPLLQSCGTTYSAKCPNGYSNGGARVGMTQQEVLCSAQGKADRVMRTETLYGTQETWVYGYSLFVFFDTTGRVYQIHNSLSR